MSGPLVDCPICGAKFRLHENAMGRWLVDCHADASGVESHVAGDTCGTVFAVKVERIVSYKVKTAIVGGL